MNKTKILYGQINCSVKLAKVSIRCYIVILRDALMISIDNVQTGHVCMPNFLQEPLLSAGDVMKMALGRFSTRYTVAVF